jgi:DNA-binding transcriptional MerR regulator
MNADRVPEDGAMKIGQLADRVGVSVETVRYYERRGLLEPPMRSDAGYRQYDQADVARLEFLLRAKELGFTLAEIHDLFATADSPASHAASTDDIAAAVRSKLESVEAQMHELAATRCRLRQLIDLCDHGDGAACLQLRLVAG